MMDCCCLCCIDCLVQGPGTMESEDFGQVEQELTQLAACGGGENYRRGM